MSYNEHQIKPAGMAINAISPTPSPLSMLDMDEHENIFTFRLSINIEKGGGVFNMILHSDADFG